MFNRELTRYLPMLLKGRAVEVEGRLQTRSYTDKENIKRYDTSIVVEKLTFPGTHDPDLKIAG
jgi:single-stranded DNA-binding protein